MNLLALVTAALLAQAEPAEEAAPEAATPAAATDQPAVANPVRSSRTPSPEELSRQLDRIRKLPPTEIGEAMDQFRRQFPTAEQAPSSPRGPSEAGATEALTEAEQVKYFARVAFNNIISGDARSLVLQSAYPFQLEDRRLEMPDELHKEWLKNLRTKRTDLLTLYDIEVLTPAEMEKKYGRPPARLNALPWKAAHTLIAVGNLSGHASVAVFRSGPAGWQMVGYHD
jgi:hypothetical protein